METIYPFIIFPFSFPYLYFCLCCRLPSAESEFRSVIITLDSQPELFLLGWNSCRAYNKTNGDCKRNPLGIYFSWGGMLMGNSDFWLHFIETQFSPAAPSQVKMYFDGISKGIIIVFHYLLDCLWGHFCYQWFNGNDRQRNIIVILYLHCIDRCN